MKKKSKLALICFFPAVLVLTALRFSLLLVGIDYETDFFYDDSIATGIICYALYALAGILFIVFGTIDRRKKGRFFRKRLSAISVPQVTVLSIVLFAAGIVYFIDFVGNVGAGDMLGTVLSFIAAFVYCLCGLTTFAAKRLLPNVGFSFIALSAVFVVEAGRMYLDNLIIVQMSDELIMLLSYLLLVLFFISAGRVYSRNEAKSTRIRMLVTGFSASLLIFSRELSILLMYAIAPSERLVAMNQSTLSLVPPLTFVANGVVLLAMLLSLYTKPGERTGKEA